MSEPTTGNSARAHRRFSFVQLHVAVILNELRRYGTNVDGLRNMASILQRAIVLGREMVGFDSVLAVGAAALADHRRAFSEGWVKDSPVYNVRDASGEVVKARTLDEWLASMMNSEEPPFQLDEIELSADPRLADKDQSFLLKIYGDLIDPSYERIRQAWSSGPNSEWFWLIYPIEGGWYIRGREDGRISLTEFIDQTSYISINVSRLIRQIWQTKGASA